MLDIADAAALQGALSAAEQVRVLALNPPGPVDGDPDAAETSTADAIVAALMPAGPERVVALSTYGARAGSAIGDLGTLHHFEQRLAALDAPVAVVRAGYLYSNWDGAAAAARDHGRLSVMTDPDRPLPMVAPADVGAERRPDCSPSPRRSAVSSTSKVRRDPLLRTSQTRSPPPVEGPSGSGGSKQARWRSEFESAGLLAPGGPPRSSDSTGSSEGETWRASTASPPAVPPPLQAYVNDLVRRRWGRPAAATGGEPVTHRAVRSCGSARRRPVAAGLGRLLGLAGARPGIGSVTRTRPAFRADGRPSRSGPVTSGRPSRAVHDRRAPDPGPGAPY